MAASLQRLLEDTAPRRRLRTLELDRLAAAPPAQWSNHSMLQFLWIRDSVSVFEWLVATLGAPYEDLLGDEVGRERGWRMVHLLESREPSATASLGYRARIMAVSRRRRGRRRGRPRRCRTRHEMNNRLLGGVDRTQRRGGLELAASNDEPLRLDRDRTPSRDALHQRAHRRVQSCLEWNQDGLAIR